MSNSDTKFEVARMDGTGNFKLMQRRVKDLLAQQNLLKALHESKLTDSVDDNWADMKEKHYKKTGH